MVEQSDYTEEFLGLVGKVDNVPLDFDFSTLFKLLLPLDPRPHGFILPSIVSKMPWTSGFEINHVKRTIQAGPGFNAKKEQWTSEAGNEVFQNLIDDAIATAAFSVLSSGHSEMYRIMGANPPIQLERFASPLFGIASRGAHMTAFVRTSTELKIWIARRSPNLYTYPNMLDTTVAGGVKATDEPLDCIVAEADEEASLPRDFVRENKVAAGAITYVTESARTGLISPTVLYVFDLELSDSHIPMPNDGEVAEFYLMTVGEVMKAMVQGEFKPNCNMVMIDFFLRHGILTPENLPDYTEITRRLKRKLPLPLSPEDVDF